MAPETAADHIADGLRKDRFEIRFPWQMALIFDILYLLPRRVYFAVGKYLR
jgi:hypothetical protein